MAARLIGVRLQAANLAQCDPKVTRI